MKWRTKISVNKKGEHYLRGHKLTGLIGKLSFTEAAFLAIQGRLPKKNETRMLDAVLVATIEHGVEVPSAFAARVSASVGNASNVALAAGMLATGDWHGGAIEGAMKALRDERTPAELVRETLAQGGRLSGFGHKIYKKEDPRASALIRLAKKLKIGTKHLNRAQAVQKELRRQTGLTLPLNVDGAIAGILLELGFDWRLGKAFFAFARMPGMMAHVEEEMKNEKPYRRLDEGDVEYLGPEIK